MGQHSTWAEWELDRVRAAAAAGLSAGSIVTELMGKTRSAILGKAKRLGVKFGIGRAPAHNPGAEARRRQAAPKRLTPFRLPRVQTFREQVKQAAADATLTSARLMLDELTFNAGRPAECRYPLEGDGALMVYCGSPVLKGQSYCAPHCRTCFNFGS